jgi:Ser/Thr protein kinase RdoA (MazF antagonist)
VTIARLADAAVAGIGYDGVVPMFTGHIRAANPGPAFRRSCDQADDPVMVVHCLDREPDEKYRCKRGEGICMNAYAELTRLGQLRRIRHLAEVALDSYGLRGARLTFLRYWANITYRVDVPGQPPPQGGSGPYVPNRYLLRVLATNHWDVAKGEMTWLAALSREAGLPVPAPIPTLEGELVTRVTTPGVPEGRLVSLMRWVAGRRRTMGFRLHHFRAWGRMVAQLHEFAAGWQPPEGFQRFVWDWEGLLGGRGFGCTVDELVASMPQPLQEPFQIVSREAQGVMEALGKGPDAYGVIHADMCPENVLFKAGNVVPIDFEDCGFGYWLWDIAVALCVQPWTEAWFGQRDAFLEGYARVRTLPESQLRHVDLFLAVQYATAVLWASLFLRGDPVRQAQHQAWRDGEGVHLLQYVEQR